MKIRKQKAESRRQKFLCHCEESLREYEELCEFWESVVDKEGLENLERLKIAFLVERRRRFDKAGGR